LCGIDRGRTGIIAWSAFRELREYATHRLSGLNVRVLSGAVADGVVRSAIDRALHDRIRDDRSAESSTDLGAADVHQMMTDLSEKARLLCGTPGVAVYLRASGETQFRASVTWTSDTPIPHSPYYAPRVFGWVLETGEALVLPDLATQPLSDVPTSTLQDVVRGLVAVPIVTTADEVIGTICVFDLKPLTLGGTEVEALKALGRSLSFGGTIASSSRSSAHEVDTPEPHEETKEAEPLDSPAFDAHDEQRAGAPGYASYADAPAPHMPALEETLSDIESKLRAATDRRQIDVAESRGTGENAALLDRRVGDFAIARELARARREKRRLSVVLFDVGPVRSDDDGASMQSAHKTLAVVRNTLTKAIRGSDLAIRWSEEGLLVVLAGLGTAEARTVAERVRAALQAGAQHSVAVSAGVAELGPDETFESVVRRADEKLQEALERGNRVA
jgi:diguanylate cyclase (GGDEF)-like protein